MKQDEFLLYDYHKSIQLHAERATFYLQGEIIEAFTNGQEVYYLLFFKQQFLTAFKAKSLRRRSFIEKAFKQGMVFEAPHPFIEILLDSNPPLKSISFNQLNKKLQMTYTLQEKAFILTFLESFIQKKQLFDEISSIFYDYRRNGQLSMGYQIVQILKGFAPNHRLVKQLTSNMEYIKYANMYNQTPEKLVAKDPVFAEKYLYSQKDSEQHFQQLSSQYEKESRWLDLMALFIYKLLKTPTTDDYRSLLHLLEKHLNEKDRVVVLEKISTQIPDFLLLQKYLFDHYVSSYNMGEIFKITKRQEFHLSENQAQTFGDLLNDYDLRPHSLQPEMLKSLMSTVIKFFPEKAERLLHKSVTTLLQAHELPYIKEWLSSFKEVQPQLSLFEKLDTMYEISEDLDQMQTLGELYVEFEQFDKAIECFSWEMELKPTEVKPVQCLMNIYRELGMDQEADAYRHLCINLQRQA
ncbi:hypothetical protein SAMN05192533_11690 [Mesobacillus persicus]|uniref:Uncharacterized protein n=1 Tax=Mesobacillus persicus TaxID=930146 RepID=A0A1H8I6X0_9BACI|nr:hypothetical protein [Mesobacillus persicus]SEN64570.1 hypothetical protein SAMN05192533_11690 [Mesobacillus persicus]